MKQTSIGWTQLRNLVGQLALILLFYAVGTDAASAAPKRVLLLYSLGLDAPPWAEYSKQLWTELVEKFQNEVDSLEATLETARIWGDVADGPFADYLIVLFSKRPLDLIQAPDATARLPADEAQSGLPPTVVSLGAPRYDCPELPRRCIQETNLCVM